MSPTLIFLIILGYFSILMLISRFTSRHSHDNTFFDGDRQSPWFLVAFGMIGSGISAVSLVSIPGNVGNNNLYYFQFILGTIAGYLFIVFVLTPLYYNLKLVSIYTYLKHRFGNTSYKTGSLFFMVSQSFGAALRLLLSIKILQAAFFDKLHIPYYLTIIIVLLLIWLYTNKSGIKTIVWTDALQSLFLITVIIISIITIKNSLGLTTGGMVKSIVHHPYARLFNWDAHSGSNFFKQFISGMLITIALVGLDQSMMQKTLTVKNVKDAKKNVLTFSFFIAFAQTLFLGLGILMYLFAEQKGISLVSLNGEFQNTDELYPLLTLNYFGQIGAIAFFIGVIASTFASIDSCIAALTTSFSYDFLDFENQSHEAKTKIKNGVLLGVNLVMFLIVMLFWNSQGAIINTIFKIAGYTYGPLLGLYITGLFTKMKLTEKWVPIACLAAALLTYLLNIYFIKAFRFDFGFMNILVNAALTILFLTIIQKKNNEYATGQ
ncbi:sodium:solute symporter [Flavihumibacter stibioxidans]|uniref:Sodium:solute symporter n=1 Tax=Flavihumibacter stibioxidans TaxID=1834163 RepID=A0ABR7M5A6_9BACT|nr:sodium:solute symporter [Flavihumibacter stibioxidans]MBC6490162.1 sodium:solute symporter [Flavihumibacter stibioxidans]